MTIIRTGPEAIKYMKDHIGDTRFAPDNITVYHHCIGIARRLHAGLGGKAYDTANAAGRAVISAGKMKRGVGPAGSLQWWFDSDAGHVALNDYDDDYVLCNVGVKIGRVDRAYYRTLVQGGWCWSWEVPGWGPATDEQIKATKAGTVVKPPPAQKPVVDYKVVKAAYKEAYDGKRSSAKGVKTVSSALRGLGFKGGNPGTNNVGNKRGRGKLGQMQAWQKSQRLVRKNGVPTRRALRKLARKSGAFTLKK